MGLGRREVVPRGAMGWKDMSVPSVPASHFNSAALAMAPCHPLMQMGGMDLMGAMFSWDPDSL